jgi:hypothetical protein
MNKALFAAALALVAMPGYAEQATASFTVGITIVAACPVTIDGVTKTLSCTSAGSAPKVVVIPASKTVFEKGVRTVNIIY